MDKQFYAILFDSTALLESPLYDNDDKIKINNYNKKIEINNDDNKK